MTDKTDKIRQNGRWIVLGIALVAIGAALIFVNVFQNSAPPEPEPIPEPEPVTAPEPVIEPARETPEYPTVRYPEGKLLVAEDRTAYENGDMILSVPRIDFEGPVLNGVDDATLAVGIGLYDYSLMPSWGNPNTSIAGHRDAYGCEFYYLDTVQEGDLIHLTWQGSLYTYQYLDTIVVDDSDWSVIHCVDVPIITLTTCTPLGTSDYRMIVTGELISIEPLE